MATLVSLGSALRAQKDYQEARAHLERALAINRMVQGEKHTETMKNLSNLGTLLKEWVDKGNTLSPSEREEALVPHTRTLRRR